MCFKFIFNCIRDRWLLSAACFVILKINTGKINTSQIGHSEILTPASRYLSGVATASVPGLVHVLRCTTLVLALFVSFSPRLHMYYRALKIDGVLPWPNTDHILNSRKHTKLRPHGRVSAVLSGSSPRIFFSVTLSPHPPPFSHLPFMNAYIYTVDCN